MEIVNYKTVYFTFGRYQPPTKGHEAHFRALKTMAGINDWFIFPSPTQGGFENPLDLKTKITYIQKGCPWTRGKVKEPARVTDAGKNNPVVATIQTLQEAGYDKCYFVVGSDRLRAFEFTRDGLGRDYSFYDYDIISSGERDADGDTFAISGTKMRRAAHAGDFTTFRKGIPRSLSDSDCRSLMNEIKAALPKDYK